MGNPGPTIRGLSPNDVSEIRAGAGAGLARAAELNGLPGPRHTLDLADELRLTGDQRTQIHAVIAAMHEEATRLGPTFLRAQERFEDDLRDPAQRDRALRACHPELTELRGELERVHLRAHIAAADLLSADQIATYNRLRGNPLAD
jgi:hypothetical protein